MLFNIIFSSPNILTGLLIFVLVAVALIISLSFHEFAHAYVANKLGDSTAKLMGRVTLDPRAHLDPTGTLLLLLVGFGWGKPVPINPINLKNQKRDTAIIAFAGPASNILLAILFSLFYHLVLPVIGGGLLSIFVELVVKYNLILAIFNLLPVNPLDGFKVVHGLLPEELSYQWIQMARYGVWILLFLILTGMTERIIFPLLGLGLSLLGF